MIKVIAVNVRNAVFLYGLLNVGLGNSAWGQFPSNSSSWNSTANPYLSDSIDNSPWYAIPGIVNQLKLTDGQISQLNAAYGLAWSRYNQDLEAVSENLAPPQRIQRQQDLSAAFRRDLMQSTDNLFSDPSVRTRFNQLYLQYRWYTAFTDLFIQEQLNLTYFQELEFRRLDADWNQQMAEWFNEYPLNRIAVTRAFNRTRQDFNYNVYSILSPQQFTLWMNLTGEPFEFNPDDYFTD